MAFTSPSAFTYDHVSQPDILLTSAADTKTNFDSRAKELRDYLVALLAEIAAVTDGDSGADNIGMTAITETGANATVQSIIEALITRLKAVTDSASGADLIGATAISGWDGATVQAILESAKAAIDAGAAVSTATITATWAGASAPYTQDVTVSGMTADYEPLICPVYSSTNATAILQQNAWNLIGKAVTGTDKITFTCFEQKPITAIPIQIKGV